MSIEQKIAELLSESNSLVSLSVEELESFMQTEKFEQLDELSKSTLGSYIKKAVRSAADKQHTASSLDKDAEASEDGDDFEHYNTLSQKYMKDSEKRTKNIDKATNRLTKEELQLDELSKSTLGSYIKKATRSASDKQGASAAYDKDADASWTRDDYDELDAKADKHMKDSEKRMKNIDKATSRLTKEELEDFMQSEEYEQLDELSKSTLASYIGHASRDATYRRGASVHGRSRGNKQEADSDYMRSVKRLHGVESAAKRLTKEDFENMSSEELEDFMQSEEYEQLDELSKDTLRSYADKADKDREYRVGAKRALTRMSTDNQYTPEYQKNLAGRADHEKKKAGDRARGVVKAIDRLHKEDFTYDASEDVNALVSGEELSEEFKTKAATIFEAAVVTRVKQELAKLEEGFDVRLNEEVEIIKEGLVEKVDGYLNYVVEQWMNDNELALESGMKNEIMESFVAGMKNVFEQHYIEVPEEKFDVLGGLQEEVESTKTKLDEQFAINVELSKQVAEMKRVSAIKEAVAGMTDLEQEKFSALAEELSYEDSNTFVSKLQTIKENYFGKKSTPVINSVVTDSPVTLTEEVASKEEIDPMMAGYLRVLGGMK